MLPLLDGAYHSNRLANVPIATSPEVAAEPCFTCVNGSSPEQFGGMVRSRVPSKILGVIPARYASSRFPGKALARLDARTVLEHVYERVSMARYLSTVVIATDDERIRDEARRFGARVQMTREDHLSGTDRVAEVASAFP